MDNKSIVETVANDITNTILISSSEKNLDVIRYVLKKYNVPSYMYSLGAENDEKVNLFCENGHWMVTNVERGHRQSESSYDDIDSASLTFFSQLSESKLKLKRMNRYYARHKTSLPHVEIKRVQEMIRNSLAKVASY
jgi:hypothetical protein